MRIERAPMKVPSGAIRISRGDFLKLGGAGLAGATLLGTTGCGVFQQGGGGEQGAGNSTFDLNLGTEIPDLDSATTSDTTSFDVLTNVMEGLYRLDPNNEPVPAAAEGVEMSNGDLTYTFTLRDGLQWSNGDPLTSHEFKYAWLRALEPETASTYAYILYYIKGAEEYNLQKGSAEDVAIETPDDKTVRATVTAKAPFFLQLTSFVTFFPQQQEFVEKLGDKYALDQDSLLYNGPFIMTQGAEGGGSTAVFKKNDKYWDKENVALKTVNGRIVKDNDTALNLYEGGELDRTALVGDKVKQYTDSPEFSQLLLPSTQYGRLNQKVPELDNINIRKALMIGFDRKSLTDNILQDGSLPAYGFVPPAINPGPGDQTFREANGDLVPKDVKSARQFWEKGVEELDGEEPKLRCSSM